MATLLFPTPEVISSNKLVPMENQIGLIPEGLHRQGWGGVELNLV